MFGFVQRLGDQLASQFGGTFLFEEIENALGGGRLGLDQQGLGVFEGPGGASLELVEAVVAGDGIEPSAELGIALEGIEVPVGRSEDFLGEIGGFFAVAGEAEAPESHFAVVAEEQFVEERIGVGVLAVFPISGNEILVAELFHRFDYSRKLWKFRSRWMRQVG